VSTTVTDSASKKYSSEEMERMRDALKQTMMQESNSLKFLMNAQVTLVKDEHCDKVCEAYFESEKTWFAALIQDVDENA